MVFVVEIVESGHSSLSRRSPTCVEFSSRSFSLLSFFLADRRERLLLMTCKE